MAIAIRIVVFSQKIELWLNQIGRRVDKVNLFDTTNEHGSWFNLNMVFLA